MATRAAAGTFTRVYSNPEALARRGEFDDRAARYRYLWAWYNSSIFDDLATWGQYKHRYKLYRYTRPIYNPTRRLVDFYAGILYPGNLTADGRQAESHGAQLAIPLAEDTPDALRAALGQSWQWSNWQARKSVLGRYGAALGDVGVEITDDPERRKVTYAPVWPGMIADLTMDGNDNVTAYRIEYEAMDEETGQPYTYARTVDKEWIATYRDDTPHAYGDQPAEYGNPYGFVPFVWIKHTDTGGTHGQPAMRNLTTWDELNSLASHNSDKAHQILAAPILVSGDGVSRLGSDPSKAGPTENLTDAQSRQESLNILKAGPGATVNTLQPNPGEALENIDRLIGQIEKDHPELTMYEKLRGMSQVTGPAAERLLGDAAIYINDARSNYDQGLIRVFQMAIAIAGWRANSGAWGKDLDAQRAAFAPFDLGSYERGDLDMEILPRPLVPATALEQMQLDRMRQGMERDNAATQAGNLDRETPAGIARRLAEAVAAGA